MGCGISGHISSYEYSKIIEKAERFERQRIFDEIGLQDVDIDKLYRVFKKFDIDKSGKMELGELIANLGLEDSPYARRVFRLFDTDGSSDIDFKEFVLSLWNYCTLTPKTLIQFAFKLFDQDDDGYLKINDMRAMIKEIYGIKSVTDPKLNGTRMSIKIWLSENEGINVRQFAEFVRNYQLLMFPAFQIQERMREKVLGSAFWVIKTNYRVRQVDGKALDLPMKARTFMTFSPRHSIVSSSSLPILSPTPILLQEELGSGSGSGITQNSTNQMISPRNSISTSITSPHPERSTPGSRRPSNLPYLHTSSDGYGITNQDQNNLSGKYINNVTSPRGDRIQSSTQLNQNPAPNWMNPQIDLSKKRRSVNMPSIQTDALSQSLSPRTSISGVNSSTYSVHNTPRNQVNVNVNATPYAIESQKRMSVPFNASSPRISQVVPTPSAQAIAQLYSPQHLPSRGHRSSVGGINSSVAGKATVLISTTSPNISPDNRKGSKSTLPSPRIQSSQLPQLPLAQIQSSTFSVKNINSSSSSGLLSPSQMNSAR